MSDKRVIRTKVGKWGGIEVSRLGFGAMRLPLTEDRKIDRDKASRLIDRAIEGGVNYFDTAYNYHNEESELFLGEALGAYPRNEFYLATKLPLSRVTAEDQVSVIFEEQLKKLKTDYIDLYMLHGMNGGRMDLLKQLKLAEKLLRLKEKGLIRNMGFSYHGFGEVFQELIDMGVWDFAQIQINYLDYKMIDAKALYDTLLAADIPCVCMEPVRGGYLANPPDEARAVLDSFGGPAITPAGWCFRWCMSMPNIAVTLSGMTTMEQLEENLDTFSAPRVLTPDAWETLDKVAGIISNTKAVPCTECRYCMECPSGVDIPEVFRIYNIYKLFKSPHRVVEDFGALDRAGKNADKCVKCGVCAPKCPQYIDIPGNLEEVYGILKEVRV